MSGKYDKDRKSQCCQKEEKPSDSGGASSPDNASEHRGQIHLNSDHRECAKSAEENFRRAIRDKNAAKVRRWRKKQKEKLEQEADEATKISKENEVLQKQKQELTDRLSQLNAAISELEKRRSQRAIQQVSVRIRVYILGLFADKVFLRFLR